MPRTPTDVVHRHKDRRVTCALFEESDLDHIVDHILLTSYEATNSSKRWRLILVLRPSDKSAVSDITVNIHQLPTGTASIFSTHTPAPKSDVEFRIETLKFYPETLTATHIVDIITTQHIYTDSRRLSRHSRHYDSLQWCVDMVDYLEGMGDVTLGSYYALLKWAESEEVQKRIPDHGPYEAVSTWKARQ